MPLRGCWCSNAPAEGDAVDLLSGCGHFGGCVAFEKIGSRCKGSNTGPEDRADRLWSGPLSDADGAPQIRKVTNPRRVGTPETGCPTRLYPETLRPSRTGTSPRRRVRGEALRQSMSLIKREKNSGGEEPQEGIDGRSNPRLVLGALGCRTDSTRE